MNRIFYLILCWGCFVAVDVFGMESTDVETQTVYALMCEDIHGEESKSEVRSRATDKACFKALEKIGELSEYRKKYDEHDYDVLIYHLVDNYLEDLTVRTINQNDNQVCVELTGYFDPKNIKIAVSKLAERQEAQYPDTLEIEEEALSLPSPTGMPPKPEIKISEEIAVDEELIAQPEPVLMPETKEEDSTTKSVPQPLQPLTEAEQNRCTKVFIERTKFFNDTSTNAFFMDISQIIEENQYLCVSMSSQEADYIVKTNVLRAKVDPINKQTNRMQMVISLELTDVENATSIVEHQNRFLLFESTEDEQKVAADLLKKLLIKGSKKIAPRIKAKADVSKEVITPSASVIKVYKQQN